MGRVAREGSDSHRRRVEVDTAGYEHSKRTVRSQGISTGTIVSTSLHGVLIRQHRHREAAGTISELDALRPMEFFKIQHGSLSAFYSRNRAKHTRLLRAASSLAIQSCAPTVLSEIIAAKHSTACTRAISAAILPPYTLRTPLPSQCMEWPWRRMWLSLLCEISRILFHGSQFWSTARGWLNPVKPIRSCRGHRFSLRPSILSTCICWNKLLI